MEDDMENIMMNQKSRLNLNVTAELNEKLNSWAETLQMTLSELTRKALSEYIERLERNKREQELAEACKNYRQFNKKFSSEWAKFETRI
jgi:metal-responsive CopG/Arc/MetJ family transcriptional regulator